MRRHPKADLYLEERNNGLNNRQIAEKYGVSYQAVASVIAKADPSRFQPFTKKQVVYPSLRRWLNENRVCKRAFLQMMGCIPGGRNTENLNNWFKGKTYPNKQNIDLIIQITGLTYEELFYREEETP